MIELLCKYADLTEVPDKMVSTWVFKTKLSPLDFAKDLLSKGIGNRQSLEENISVIESRIKMPL